MTATKGLGTYGNGVGTVTPLDHKMAQLGLIVKTATNTIRPGLFWDGSTTVVSGKANMSYDVRALSAVTSRGATAGAVLLTNDAVVNVVTTAAPGSNSRYDVVYLWQREFALDGTDSNPVIGVVQGTAAASPLVPSLTAFPGAIELARILVPAGVTATNSGTTITQTAPFTATDGSPIPFRNSTERDAAGSFPAGTRCRLLDVEQDFIYSSGWKANTGGLVLVGRQTVAGSTTITLDSVFTAAFANYLILVNLAVAGTGGIGLMLRAGGSSTATGYDNQRATHINTTTTDIQVLNSTSATVSGISLASQNAGQINLYSPNLATATWGDVTMLTTPNPMTTSGGTFGNGFQQRATTQFDGFVLTSSSNLTGTVTVYGYA